MKTKLKSFQQLFVASSADLNFFEITYAEPFNEPKMQLDPGWINFAQVQEGTVIDKRGDNSAFTAPREGMLLFPKYPSRTDSGDAKTPVPKEIYNLVSAMQGHPLELCPEL